MIDGDVGCERKRSCERRWNKHGQKQPAALRLQGDKDHSKQWDEKAKKCQVISHHSTGCPRGRDESEVRMRHDRRTTANEKSRLEHGDDRSDCAAYQQVDASWRPQNRCCEDEKRGNDQRAIPERAQAEYEPEKSSTSRIDGSKLGRSLVRQRYLGSLQAGANVARDGFTLFLVQQLRHTV